MILCECIIPRRSQGNLCLDVTVSALAVLNLQCDGHSSSMRMMGGHRISEVEESACVVTPGAICRWAVAFKLLFEEPSDRIFGYLCDVWLLDDTLIFKI